MPSYGVFIGRFQPVHNAHLDVMRRGLRNYDRLIVLVGSAKEARSPKNPFTAEERIGMIRSCFSPSEQDRMMLVPLRDQLYNENQWIVDVQQKVTFLVDNAEPGPISLLGRIKDRSSYYIRLFPQWKCEEMNEHQPLDATTIRDKYFSGRLDYQADVHSSVQAWLEDWSKTDTYQWVVQERRYYQEYRDKWAAAPYPPKFLTADAVVIQSGHVLLVRRRTAPGKGLFALPGGFVQEETTRVAALRELREETGIMVAKEILDANIVDQKLFDHPDRSLRGHVVSNAFCIRLRDGDLPKVKGADDADRAFWMPLVELFDHEEKFFEDHAHIVRYFTNRF